MTTHRRHCAHGRCTFSLPFPLFRGKAVALSTAINRVRSAPAEGSESVLDVVALDSADGGGLAKRARLRGRDMDELELDDSGDENMKP
jgi:hypothetical protein